MVDNEMNEDWQANEKEQSRCKSGYNCQKRKISEEAIQKSEGLTENNQEKNRPFHHLGPQTIYRVHKNERKVYLLVEDSCK